MEGAVIGAFDGFEAAVEAGEGRQVGEIGVGEVGAVGGKALLPEAGFDGVEAAELPVVAGEGIDQRTFQRCGGPELLMVRGGEFLELFGIFAGNDFGSGLDAGFQGVESGDGLALDGAWPGRAKRVEPVRCDLSCGSHGFQFQA